MAQFDSVLSRSRQQPYIILVINGFFVFYVLQITQTRTRCAYDRYL